MPIQPMGFRALQAEDVSPFNTAFQTGLQNYVNIAKAQYAPQREQSDILSKAAYATYTPYGYLSKALSDPMVMAQLARDPANLKRVTDMLAGIPTNPMQSLWNNFNQQNGGQPQNGGQSQPPGNGLSNLSMGDQNNATQLPSSSDAAQIATMKPGDQYVFGSNQPPQQTPIDPAMQATMNPQTQTPIGANAGSVNLADPKMNAFNQDFGSPQSNTAAAIKYPSPTQKIATAVQTAGQSQQVRSNAEIQAKETNLLNKEAYADSLSAFNLSNNANKFKQAYDAAIIKGGWANIPGIEKLAQFDPEARDAMNAASNASVALASQLFGNRQSDYREKLAQSLKFSINMPEKTVNDVMAGVQAESTRLQEHTDFVQEAQRLGITDPNKIRNAWFDYNRDKPFYDPKTRKANIDNLNSYPDYLANKATGASSNGISVEHEGKTYKYVGGRWMQS